MHPHTARLVATLLLAVAALAPAAPPAAAQLACEDTFAPLFERGRVGGQSIAVADLQALDATTLFAVGSRSDPAGGTYPLALLSSGGVWRAAPVPFTGAIGWLSAIAAGSPAGAVAVGARQIVANTAGDNRPLAVRWDGAAWSPLPTPIDAGSGQLNDVARAPDGSAWAVGISAGRPIALRFSAGDVLALPIPTSAEYAEMTHIAFVGDTAWAAGRYFEDGQPRLLLVRWVAGRWESVPVDGPAEAVNFVEALAADPAGGVWLAGGFLTSNQVFRYSGGSWSELPFGPSDRPTNISGIVALGPQNVWVSSDGANFQWDGATWHRRARPPAVQSARLAGLAGGRLFYWGGANNGVQIGEVLAEPALQFRSVAGGDVSAGQATAVVTVSPPVPRPLTVRYSSADGSAVAGRDYTAVSGTLTIPACAGSASFTVPLLTPPSWAGLRTASLRLSEPVGARLGAPANTSLTISDRARAPQGTWQALPQLPATLAPAPYAIVFAGGPAGEADIYAMRADGRGQRNLTASPGDDSRPAWSPDGRRIAFNSRRSGTSQVYVMNADGSGLIQLTNQPFDALGATWSPDGSEIAFTTITRPPPAPGEPAVCCQMLAVRVDSGQVRRIVGPSGTISEDDPSWSPDGRTIAYTYGAPPDFRNRLMLLDVATGALRQVDHPGEVYGAPSWSPDGRSLALLLINFPDAALYIYDVASGGLREANPNFAVGGLGNAWLPDGAGIAYADGNLIAVSGLDGKAPGVLAARGDPFYRELDWAPR